MGLLRDLIFEFGIVSLFVAPFSVAGQVCVPESPTSKVGTPSRDIDPASRSGINWLSWSVRLSSVFKTPPFLWEMIICMVNVKKWITNFKAIAIIMTIKLAILWVLYVFCPFSGPKFVSPEAWQPEDLRSPCCLASTEPKPWLVIGFQQIGSIGFAETTFSG